MAEITIEFTGQIEDIDALTDELLEPGCIS
jgi:hypothetical protein